MPIAIIAVVVVAALGAGFFFFTSTQSETATEPASEIAARPTDEVEENTPAPTTDDDVNEETDEESEETAEDTPLTVATDTEVAANIEPESTTMYADGTYTASASYLTPRRTEHLVGVTLTIENDVVVDSMVTYDGDENNYSNDNQARFDQAYATEVVGKPLDTISLSRVGGASLTSGAFNEAKAKIVTEARS